MGRRSFEGRGAARASAFAAVVALVFAPAAVASYGQMRFGCIPPAFAALIGIVLAAVPAAACVVLELVFSRRSPPLAVSAVSALLAAALVAVAAGGLEKLGLAILLFPVFAVLALLGFTRNSLHRAALGTAFTVAILVLVLQRFELLDASCGYAASHTGFVAATATILLPWLATLLRRQRAQLREDAASFVPAALARGTETSVASAELRNAVWRNPLTYIAGGTALAIVVVAGLGELGWPHAWYGLLEVEAAARDFLGLPQPEPAGWWSPRLALWGLVFAAGLWAIASYAGKVDAGRWAPLRLLCVIAAVAALAVAWHASQRRASIEAAERAASETR